MQYQQNDNNGLLNVNLQPVNYDNVQPFKKNFYSPSDAVRSRSTSEVQALNTKYEITANGRDIENIKPLALFSEANFPDFIMQEIQRQGFTEPTSIQAGSLPAVLSGRNFVGIAKTGSGKTLAYMLPAFIHCKNQAPVRSGDGPIVLVLAPTRELAQQIQTVANNFGIRNNISNV
jgi:superfamily II DNA/RNA helicase